MSPLELLWWMRLMRCKSFRILTAHVPGQHASAATNQHRYPVATLIGRQRNGAPAQVIFLPSFWLLVPGASSLAGLSELLSGSSSGIGGTVGLVTLLNALVTVLAIAIGVLVGSGLTQSVSDLGS